MSLIKKIQKDIDVIEKNYPHYELKSSKHDTEGTLVYLAFNTNENREETLTIGVDHDGSRKLCKRNGEKWALVGDLKEPI